jgi:hypothetical protein
LFVVLIIICIAGLVQMGENEANSALATGFTGVIALVYLSVIIAIYVYPIIALYQFATKAQVALRSESQESLNASFMHLNGFFKFWAILAIIAAFIYVIAFIILALVFSSGGLAPSVFNPTVTNS